MTKRTRVRGGIEIKPIAWVTCGSSAGVWLSPREIYSDVLVTHPPDFLSGPTTEERAKKVQLR
ncbi:hypothetical protein ASPTUDRAFT_38424 [Aspergillus tubingensis CBS 134.48]|uniref:Uncharacterized protein n=1 Tax=Aspergillus tubingensis (strain CBS 134.48) TaxID=767770 RepID=A0A1L9NQ18_ASPTC|nr:hypothetical protein ASPTUDRAFT_38424 [Aspergillus tubingensis CBS 134.48]